MSVPSRVAALGSAIALSLLTACGGGADTAGSGSGAPPAAAGSGEISEQRNAVDVEFAQGMIPHHRQAVEMSELAADRAQSEEVKALAEQISAAQGPEIETMTKFLETWGEPVPEGSSMGGMDHGGMDMGGMPGMMTPEQMTELRNAEGAAFDRMFLEMMIAHHEGAVEMTHVEHVDGVNPQAKELAEQIETAQTEEISRMRDLLAGM